MTQANVVAAPRAHARRGRRERRAATARTCTTRSRTRRSSRRSTSSARSCASRSTSRNQTAGGAGRSKPPTTKEEGNDGRCNGGHGPRWRTRRRGDGARARRSSSMVVMSGDMDKLFGAFIIATGAAAMGMDVTMFFTFWGLRALKKDVRTGNDAVRQDAGRHVRRRHHASPTRASSASAGWAAGCSGR